MQLISKYRRVTRYEADMRACLLPQSRPPLDGRRCSPTPPKPTSVIHIAASTQPTTAADISTRSSVPGDTFRIDMPPSSSCVPSNPSYSAIVPILFCFCCWALMHSTYLSSRTDCSDAKNNCVIDHAIILLPISSCCCNFMRPRLRERPCHLSMYYLLHAGCLWKY